MRTNFSTAPGWHRVSNPCWVRRARWEFSVPNETDLNGGKLRLSPNKTTDLRCKAWWRDRICRWLFQECFAFLLGLISLLVSALSETTCPRCSSIFRPCAAGGGRHLNFLFLFQTTKMFELARQALSTCFGAVIVRMMKTLNVLPGGGSFQDAKRELIASF